MVGIRQELRRMKALTGPRESSSHVGTKTIPRVLRRPGVLSDESNRQDNRADVGDDGAMRLLVVITSLAAILGWAVPAQADPGATDPGLDGNFLGQLNQAGIHYSNGPAAVTAARTACDMMDSGQKEIDVIKQVMQLNPGFGLSGSTRFTAIASSVYCPDYLSKSSAKTSTPMFPGLGGR